MKRWALTKAQWMVIAVTVVLLLIAAFHPVRTFRRLEGVTIDDYRPVRVFCGFVAGLAVVLLALLHRWDKDEPQ